MTTSCKSLNEDVDGTRSSSVERQTCIPRLLSTRHPSFPLHSIINLIQPRAYTIYYAASAVISTFCAFKSKHRVSAPVKKRNSRAGPAWDRMTSRGTCKSTCQRPVSASSDPSPSRTWIMERKMICRAGFLFQDPFAFCSRSLVRLSMLNGTSSD